MIYYLTSHLHLHQHYKLFHNHHNKKSSNLRQQAQHDQHDQHYHRQQPQQQNIHQHTQQQQNFHLEITSPTHHQHNIFMPGSFGMSTEQMGQPAVRIPVRRQRSRTPSKQIASQEATTAEAIQQPSITEQQLHHQPRTKHLSGKSKSYNNTSPLQQQHLS